MHDHLVAAPGDITRLAGYAIVRAVVAGEKGDPLADPILFAGGKELAEHAAAIEPLVEARPIVTPPYGLPATAVVHVAAPRWRNGQGDEDWRLALTIERVLYVARRERFSRVAFSPIGPGFPLDRAAEIAAITAHAALFAAPEIAEVRFVCPSRTSLRAYRDAISAVTD
ncbi:MAG TPA: macro domain-containing protein [Thermomicrobiales bacterium]|jgi:O-acetyl-ADP-ribose deacetylase (regulator of RNase III)|nr:macro domain-containing protein [Thermomicrobiales bacterium]